VVAVGLSFQDFSRLERAIGLRKEGNQEGFSDENRVQM
jgi:hypothetical protein